MNASLVSALIALIVTVGGGLISLFIIIAPWRCLIWLKKIHQQNEIMDAQRRREAQDILQVLRTIACAVDSGREGAEIAKE